VDGRSDLDGQRVDLPVLLSQLLSQLSSRCLQAKCRNDNSPDQQPEFERGGESRPWSRFAALQPQPFWLPIESRWKLTVSMSLLDRDSVAAEENSRSSIVHGEEVRLEQALGGGVQSRGTV